MAIGIPVTDIKYKCTILHGIPDSLAPYASQTLNSLAIASRYTGKPVNISELINMISKEAECAKAWCATKDQAQAQGKGKAGSQTDKALAADATSEGSNSRRCKVKCHHCGKEGHWVRKCHTKKREEATAAANQSGQSAQANTSTNTKLENKPVGSTNATFEDDLDNSRFWATTTEDVAPVHPYCAEPDPLMGELEDGNDNEWDAFRTETWGAEDEEDSDWAGFNIQLVKEGEERDVKEAAGAAALPKEEDTPCSKSQPAPHNALHAHTISNGLVPRQALDEGGYTPQIGDGCPRTTSSCREQVTDTMRHAHCLHSVVRPPESTHLNDPKPAICTCKGQSPGFDTDVQAH